MWCHFGFERVWGPSYNAEPFFYLRPHRFPRQRGEYRTLADMDNETRPSVPTPQDYIQAIFGHNYQEEYGFLDCFLPSEKIRVLRFLFSHDSLLRRLS